MVNLSSFWRGPRAEDGSLYTYLRTRKWGAPLEFSEASIPRGWNVNTADLWDPELSQLITSLSSLPFQFPPFSIIPLLPPRPSFTVSFSFILFSFSNGSQTMPEAFLYSCMSEEAGDYRSEESCRGLLLCERNHACLALTKADFRTRNSCLWREPWDSFLDMTRGWEGRM